MFTASTILINAPIEQVWDLTTDLEGWPALSSNMTSVERLDHGPLRVGSTARVVQPRLRPATWLVIAMDEPTRFVWQTRTRGLAITESHYLTRTAGGCVRRIELEVTGLGSGLASRILNSTTREAVAMTNAGFKVAAERAAQYRSWSCHPAHGG